MQTISRNTNAFRDAIANAHDVYGFELSSYFEGFKTTPERLANAAQRGKLVKTGHDTYRLSVHNNQWFEFKAA